MAAKVHFIVYDLRESDHPEGPKLTRARHDSPLKLVIEQAECDRGYGRNVVRIEDAKGKEVWK